MPGIKNEKTLNVSCDQVLTTHILVEVSRVQANTVTATLLRLDNLGVVSTDNEGVVGSQVGEIAGFSGWTIHIAILVSTACTQRVHSLDPSVSRIIKRHELESIVKVSTDH
jgi:hypothetical protein